MVKALFHTNILIDYLNGLPAARDELNRYEVKAISSVTWMEVMIGVTAQLEAATREFLNGFEIIPLDDHVAECAIAFRKTGKSKLPDAIIWASAQAHDAILITRNVKDFPADNPGVRLPYVI